MTPIEKAKSLIEKFQKYCSHKEDLNKGFGVIKTIEVYNKDKALACAKTCVNEIIDDIPMYLGNLNPKWYYWNEVKKELENY